MAVRNATRSSQRPLHPTADATPIDQVYVDSFSMDKTDVTNDQFSESPWALRTGVER